MQKTPLIGIVALSVLALGACSTSGTGTNSPDSETLTKVTVGVIPIVDAAPIWLGQEKGFFADAGLDLHIETGTGGAALIPGVVAGTFDFAFGNYVSSMVAREKGLDLKYVMNAISISDAPQSHAVIVADDSDIQTPADLAGKTVGVNNLGNIDEITIRSIVAADGGDESTINFVEVAFPDAEAAVTNEQVDAARLNDPLLAAAVSHGVRIIMDNFAEFHPDLDISGYFAAGDTITDKPDLVEAFVGAMNRSFEYAQAHPDEIREISMTFTKMTAEQLDTIRLATYTSEFHRDAIEQLGEAAVKYGILDSLPDLTKLLL